MLLGHIFSYSFRCCRSFKFETLLPFRNAEWIWMPLSSRVVLKYGLPRWGRDTPHPSSGRRGAIPTGRISFWVLWKCRGVLVVDLGMGEDLSGNVGPRLCLLPSLVKLSLPSLWAGDNDASLQGCGEDYTMMFIKPTHNWCLWMVCAFFKCIFYFAPASSPALRNGWAVYPKELTHGGFEFKKRPHFWAHWELTLTSRNGTLNPGLALGLKKYLTAVLYKKTIYTLAIQLRKCREDCTGSRWPRPFEWGHAKSTQVRWMLSNSYIFHLGQC